MIPQVGQIFIDNGQQVIIHNVYEIHKLNRNYIIYNIFYSPVNRTNEYGGRAIYIREEQFCPGLHILPDEKIFKWKNISI